MGKGTCKSLFHFHSLNLAKTIMPKSILKVIIPVINLNSINSTHGDLQNFVNKTKCRKFQNDIGDLVGCIIQIFLYEGYPKWEHFHLTVNFPLLEDLQHILLQDN